MTSLRGGAARTLRMRRWPLRSYFLLLVGLFVAAAASAGVYVEIQTERDGRRAAEVEAKLAAQTAAKQLGSHIDLVQASVRQMAANPQTTQTLIRPEGCSLTFGGIAGPDRSHFDILRADGTVACSSRAPAGTRLARYAGSWVRRAAARPLFIAPAVDTATGAQVAISAAPLPQGKGIVAAFVDLAPVGPHFASLYGGSGRIEFLVTSSEGRTVVARSIDPARWVGASLSATAFARAGGRVERPDLNGRARLYAQARLPALGWTFYAGKDKAAALAAGTRLKNRQLAIIGVGLFAVLLAAWLVYRDLVTPLRRLSGAVRSMTADPVPALVPTSGPTEVTALGNAINGLISSVNHELVERRRAEAEARAVLEATLDAVITIDERGRILEFNRAAESVFGHRRADVLGKQIADVVIPPSLRADHVRGMKRYLETGEGQVIGKRIELSALRADGREFPVELAISRVPMDGPAVFTGFIRDLSDRKHAERQLRELAAIVESSRDAILSRTVDGVVTSWNAAAERMYGYSAEEIVGRSIMMLAPPERRQELDAINERLGRGEIVEPFETVRVRKDGTLIEVESSISPIIDESGRVVGASAISRDISERKRVYAALRESEARYRDLFENATDLIAIVDLESRFTAVNEAFVRTLGYSREELIGRRVGELVPPEWHERLQQAYDGKLGGKLDATVYEHELLAKDGRRIQVEVASRLIEREGHPIGTEAICRDISERKHLEEQLRQSQRLESIGRLAGGIAHDFNNLLTVITGYSEALLDQGDASIEPELAEIAAAAERATILIRQLLAFSRRQVLQPKVLSLNDVVAGIMPMLTRLIGEDVDFVASLDPALDPVLADPNQIEQVLLNLVINARDAMPHGGKLTIETGNADLDESYVAEHPEARRGRHATLVVSDNGVGMDAETLARVFEPFFTTKPVGAGTGLGLSTVYGIVKQSGGNVWAYSEPGGGSTFRLYLPAVAEPLAEAAAEPPKVVTPIGTEKILIVEDEDQVRALAAGALSKRGYEVLTTASPVEALRLADSKERPIDLLLTDLVMPEMNGQELAEHVAARIPSVRVLFMSGYADEAVMHNGTLEAGTAYLEKPFSGRDLALKVREVLDHRQPSGWKSVA